MRLKRREDIYKADAFRLGDLAHSLRVIAKHDIEAVHVFRSIGRWA